MIEQYPWLAILPPVVTIVLAIATRKVKISLGLGIIAAALLLADFNPLRMFVEIWNGFAAQFWEEGAFSTYNLFILVFLVMLGAITSFVFMSGGTAAFSEWASKRIKSRRGAQLLALVLALVLFIDDYFSALAVGQVSRPITDRHNVSRAKLSYIVDSTAAPMTVLVPFSSWGASIMALLAPVVAKSSLDKSDLGTFLGAAAANYYGIAALVLVIVAVLLQLDIGSMRTEERRAIKHADVHEEGAEIPGELSEDLPIHDDGAKRALIVPFVGLIIAVVATMYLTGYISSGSPNPIDALGSTMLTESLVIGGGVGLLLALWFYWKATKDNDDFTWKTVLQGFWEGFKSMWPAIAILLLAWTLGTLIGSLGTGEFLAKLVESSDLPPAWLLPVMFVAAGFMAFSTGTSWGSFGLLIPIAGDIILNLGADDLLIAALGAVLAGAVLGDHISPISDTTILSATGSQANIITHVETQLPYSMVAAGSALVGYFVAATTKSVLPGLIATLVVMSILVYVLQRMTTVLVDEIPESEQADIEPVE